MKFLKLLLIGVLSLPAVSYISLPCKYSSTTRWLKHNIASPILNEQVLRTPMLDIFSLAMLDVPYKLGVSAKFDSLVEAAVKSKLCLLIPDSGRTYHVVVPKSEIGSLAKDQFVWYDMEELYEMIHMNISETMSTFHGDYFLLHESAMRTIRNQVATMLEDDSWRRFSDMTLPDLLSLPMTDIYTSSGIASEKFDFTKPLVHQRNASVSDIPTYESYQSGDHFAFSMASRSEAGFDWVQLLRTNDVRSQKYLIVYKYTTPGAKPVDMGAAWDSVMKALRTRNWKSDHVLLVLTSVYEPAKHKDVFLKQVLKDGNVLLQNGMLFERYLGPTMWNIFFTTELLMEYKEDASKGIVRRYPLFIRNKTV